MLISLSQSLIRQPLLRIAGYVRERTREAVTPDALRASIKVRKEHYDNPGLAPIDFRNKGNNAHLPFVFSNKASLNVGEAVDFAPAVVQQGAASGDRANGLGTPLLFHNFHLHWNTQKYSVACFIIESRSAEGSYLVTAKLPSAAYALMEQSFRSTEPL
ncbi:hypothetical protein NLG97_g11192 [Lecanicillium saksenae]|uniref:Uncharacterized protein n=1 Tax=Lecanicillium saksenae TaxID=468837 RepID=A0ACC1QB84_9HYPO|nr:hypothetical protein NLG97_g11192 [Lecanicillium saksenae]